jgi:hypothetical protein
MPRFAEFGRLGRESDVAGHRQLAPTPQTKPVDRSDGGLGEPVRRVEHRARGRHAVLHHGGASLELADIRNRNECLLARAGEDHDPDIVVVLERIERRDQRSAGRRVQRVQLVGSVDRHRGDGARDRAQDDVVGHS